MIPVSEPVLGGREAEYVAECLRTGWISSSGRFIEAFEDEWARYCGRRFGVAVANGTVALQLAVAALGIGPGDEVILPSFTIISCVLAVVAAGATPVLVDADPGTWCMDVDQVAAKITPRTRAVMPVHIYGHPVNMDPLLSICANRGIAIIEDAAEAHGAEYQSGGSDGGSWARCGSFGEVSCFSFYANKIVTTGEGGMVLTDDPGIAERLRLLRNLAFSPERRFLHRELGFNFRITNMQAAIGLAQVERVQDVLVRKRSLGELYQQRLRDIQGIRTQIQQPWARGVYWMNGIVLEHEIGLDAGTLAGRLRERGIETRPFFLGMHRQPALVERGLFGRDHHPRSDELSERGLYLPSGVALEHETAISIVETLRDELR